MNKIEQRVQRYLEETKPLLEKLQQDKQLLLFIRDKKKLEEKFLADIISLSKTL